MLEKIKGNPRIDKLRIIQLFEADFNVALKIKIGQQLMRHPHMNTILGNDMHGVHNRRTAHDTLITQKITINIAKQKQIPGTILNLDVSKCFDKLFPNMSALDFKSVVTPKCFCCVLMKTISNMKQKVRTAHGVSKIIYIVLPRRSMVWCWAGQWILYPNMAFSLNE